MEATVGPTHHAVLQQDVHSSHFVLHLPVVIVRVHGRPYDQVIPTVLVKVSDGETVTEVRPQLVAGDVLQVDQVVRVDGNLGWVEVAIRVVLEGPTTCEAGRWNHLERREPKKVTADLLALFSLVWRANRQVDFSSVLLHRIMRRQLLESSN